MLKRRLATVAAGRDVEVSDAFVWPRGQTKGGDATAKSPDRATRKHMTPYSAIVVKHTHGHAELPTAMRVEDRKKSPWAQPLLLRSHRGEEPGARTQLAAHFALARTCSSVPTASHGSRSGPTGPTATSPTRGGADPSSVLAESGRQGGTPAGAQSRSGEAWRRSSASALCVWHPPAAGA